jgi:stage II sporulation protein D
MPRSWPPNALDAQAIASRTYALYLKAKNRFLPFDLDATTSSQVYGGYDAETPQTNAAVNATRGQVMVYADQLILAYFHSNSGGHTENAADVWRVDHPYLRGVSDPFSRGVPNGRWDYPLSFSVASQRLNRAGLNVGAIRAIRVLSRSASGRVLSLGLDTDQGCSVISAHHFRMLVDAKGIKSTLFHIVPGPSGIRLRGVGHGHGVGMSQWGARKMAQAGYSYRDILTTYYPGITLTTLGPMRSGL